MKKLRHRLFASVVFVTAIAISSTSQASSSDITKQSLVSAIDIPYESFHLKNGLKVIVHTDRSKPTVFVGMWYKVGSKDEPMGKSGFAHLFEHLMFKDTINRKGDFFAPFTEAGATGMNGTTSFDRTNYFATVPTPALDMALWMESDRMSYILEAIDQKALDDERKVVKNEKRLSMDRPYAKVFPRMLKGLYPMGHPYRETVIGSMQDLNDASLDDVRQWFNKYYGASNAFLVLAGDVDVQTAKKKVTKYFASASVGEPIEVYESWVPVLQNNKNDSMYDKVPETVISRTWHLPPKGNQDTSLMHFVSKTLVENKNSPLYKKLIDELKLATSVSAYIYEGMIASTFNLDVNLVDGVDTKVVESIIDDTLANYIKNGPSKKLLASEKLAHLKGYVSHLERVSNRGFLLANGFLITNNPAFYKKELDWQNSVSKKGLKEVAKTWLSKHYYQLIVKPFPEHSSAEQDVNRAIIPVVDQVATDIRFPKTQEATLSNGIKLVAANYGKLPLLKVRVKFDTGRFAEHSTEAGAAMAFAQLLDKGTKKYDASELSFKLDEIAMQLNTWADTQTSGIDYEILTPYLEESFSLISEMLKNATFPEQEFGKFKQRWSASIKNTESDPSSNAGALFQRAVYGVKNINGRILTPEDSSQLSRRALQAFVEREVTPANMTVYILGDIDLDAARKALDRNLGKWQKKGVSSLQSIGPALAKKAQVILVDQPESTQTSITVGHALPAFDKDSDTQISAINEIFGGDFGARINSNIRADKGWSYGIYSRLLRNPSGDQAIAISGAVQADKTIESILELKKEYEQFVSSHPATEDELQRVVLREVRSIVGSFSTSIDFLNSMAQAESYGLPYNYEQGIPKRFERLSLGEVNRLAKQLIDPNSLIWVIVGDLGKIKKDIKKLKLGETVVWDAFGRPVR